MGQNRQLLRNKIEAELQSKIAAAKTTLTACMQAQSTVEQNVAQAKQEVQTNFESMRKALVSRKNELSRDIDSQGQAHSTILQARIQATCLLLGSLQSTLSNLDSFEHGQLMNLEIKDDASIQHVPLPYTPLLKTNFDCEQLKADINAWGVIGDAAQGRTETAHASIAGTSASSNNDADMRNDFVLLSHGSDSESDDDDLPDLEVIPELSPSPALAKEQVAQIPKMVADFFEWEPSSPDPSGLLNRFPDEASYYPVPFDQEIRALERNPWLSQTKNDRRSEADDFEVLSMEQDTEQPCESETANVTSTSYEHVVPDISAVSCSPDEEDEKTSQVSNDAESGAPVVEENQSEISKWLKASQWYRNPSTSSVDSVGKDMTMTAGTRSVSKVATKNRFFEYPGLRLDPNCWLHRAPAKGLEEILHHSSDDVSMTLNQKEIIPPTYALPYPFWLKK